MDEVQETPSAKLDHPPADNKFRPNVPLLNLCVSSGAPGQDAAQWARRCKVTAHPKAQRFDGSDLQKDAKLFELRDHLAGRAEAWYNGLMESIREDFDVVLRVLPEPFPLDDPVDATQALDAFSRLTQSK